MKFIYLGMFIILLACRIPGQVTNGTIKGTVTNSGTKEALPGTTVLLLHTKSGAVTDINGEYTITALQPGNYILEFRLVGFESTVKTDVQVKPGRVSIINAELKEKAVQTENVTVTAGYFQDAELNGSGVVNFNAEEIRRSPGSMGDLSRILLALPATAKVSDDNNDLIVRGGSPAENGFYIDGIPVPNINHFPSIGSTGGPIGIINVDYVDNFNFMPGNFSSEFGDRLSSVVDIKYREGNREQFNAKADLNWAGFGGGAEGPLPGKGGSWLASFRRSYLDLISKAENWGMVIRYGDAQTKIVYDLGQKHKLTFLTLYAYDNESYGRSDALDQGSNYYGKIDNYQYTTGIQWRALWSRNFYSINTLSLSVQSFQNNFDNVNGGTKYYTSDNLEKTLTLRNANYFEIDKQNKIEAGLEAKIETGDYRYTKYAWTNRLGSREPDYTVGRSITPRQLGLYATYTILPFNALTVSAGSRMDYYALSKALLFAPRLLATLQMNERLSFRLSGGLLHQQLPLVLLAGKPEFSSLKEANASHYALGVEYLFLPDLKLSIDVYDKEYKQLPLSNDDPTLNVIDGSVTGNAFGSYQVLQSSGKGFTRGVELLLQKKMSDAWYGIVSASFFRSRYQDLTGTWRDRMYDNKFTFSFIAGYKPSADWEVSTRWTFAGGCPYSPIDRDKSIIAQSAVVDDSRINGARYPDYHSLNFRVDKKFFFLNQSLDIYLSVWNAYNRKNVSNYYWNVDKQEIKPIYQWELMPIFGVVYEF